MMARRSFRRFTPRPRSNARKFRWIVSSGSLLLPFNSVQSFVMLAPPPANLVSDIQYQQMTMPTLVRVMGHITIAAAVSFAIGVSKGSESLNYGFGIYSDDDVATSATTLFPLNNGNSNSWMYHRTGVVASTLYTADATRSAYSQTDFAFRRYELDLRKYKRKLDSFSDTLLFNVQNGTTSSPGAVQLLAVFYFRMLLLE